MLSRGDAASTYEKIVNTLKSDDYHFHTSDGADIDKTSMTYEEFMERLPSFEYLDTNNETYNKFYINPLIRILLIISAEKDEETGMVRFDKITFELVEFVYEQLRLSVDHGYRLAIDDARRQISNLFRTDRNLDDIK